MPVANYQPLAGKYGRIKVGANSATNILNLSEHELRASADDIDCTHFESDVDTMPNINVYEEGLVGVVGAEIMIRGRFDGANPPHLTPLYLFPGVFGVAFLGLTKGFGFTVPYRCLSTPISTGVKDAARFEGRLKSNGLITLPSGSTTNVPGS